MKRVSTLSDDEAITWLRESCYYADIGRKAEKWTKSERSRAIKADELAIAYLLGQLSASNQRVAK